MKRGFMLLLPKPQEPLKPGLVALSKEGEKKHVLEMAKVLDPLKGI